VASTPETIIKSRHTVCRPSEAALMRSELTRLSHRHLDCRTITDGFPGALMPRRTMSAMEPIAELRRTLGYVRNDA
jgi:hypothetical protein